MREKNSKTGVFIVAEMSANHLQDLERAKKIIDAAVLAGADAIKLQTYTPDTLTVNCRKEEFLATPGSPWDGQNLYALYQNAYMPWDWQEVLFRYAKEKGICCFSAPFDLTAVDFLEKLDNPVYKIGSFEIMDIPLIKKAARLQKPMILSTGLATLSDIERAVAACHDVGNHRLAILKCMSFYPTPFEEMNLRTIQNMAETFQADIGISDHSLGMEAAIAGVSLGAKIVEKHLTLRRADGGPDADFSMEPEEFADMVQRIRNVEKALGTVSYQLTPKQKQSRERGRSLYVVERVQRGEAFTEKNIRSIRPGYGLPPWHYEAILGKKATCDLEMGTALKWEHIENVTIEEK